MYVCFRQSAVLDEMRRDNNQSVLSLVSKIPYANRTKGKGKERVKGRGRKRMKKRCEEEGGGTLIPNICKMCLMYVDKDSSSSWK